MLPKLQISAFLLKRIEQVKHKCSGCLFGIFYGESTLLLMGFNIESTIGQINYAQIQHRFPAELDLCGLIRFGDTLDADLSETILKDVDITDNPILLQCQLGTLVGLRASILVHGKLQESAVPYEVVDAEHLYRDFCYTRLKCSLNLLTEQNTEGVQRAMQKLRKVVADGTLIFNVATSKVYITNAGQHGEIASKSASITNESLIGEIVEAIGEELLDTDTQKYKELQKQQQQHKDKKKNKLTLSLSKVFGAIGSNYDVININVLRNKTRETAPHLATRVFIKHASKTLVCVPLEFEALAMLCKKTKVGRLYDIIIESICRALRLLEQSLLENLEHNESAKLLEPRIYHFFPLEFGHFLTCSYLDGISDDEPRVQERRKRLHRHFGLPLTRPYFRRANRCVFHDEQNAAKSTPLLNTHIGLRSSGIKDGKQYLVQGNYHYYHYLQQQVQDKGWGCAYRSLQTICSWFVLQGYTTRSIPTHREVQEHLYKIGDKPSSFVGSNQWIGSTEVSICLQGFLYVESKIIHVTSGAELVTIATELAMHFQTQGTPIMIGGGVLAHTIIGIDCCVQTGQIKFLILDPHYTGADDLYLIQSKGWCGWKGSDFWDKKSYYNLCLPQRPIMF